MAPPTALFPVSDLENRIQYHTIDFKEKRRKIRNFDLETCELLELVQYSCTTLKEQSDKAAAGEPNPGRMDCYPFVRLFRRCGKGPKMFHVETTAWEGEHAYEAPAQSAPHKATRQSVENEERPADDTFASYGSYFWSKK